MGLADGSERSGPRIGAFEVSYKLVNTTSGRQYGPVEIFSKIQTGHWPGAASKLVKRVQERLQGFLAADVGAGALFQHVRGLASPAADAARSLPNWLCLLPTGMNVASPLCPLPAAFARPSVAVAPLPYERRSACTHRSLTRSCCPDAARAPLDTAGASGGAE